ncbi:hypothetical protein V1291_000050 [Nitrobacteraceae bacterium AZCC 1564]
MATAQEAVRRLTIQSSVQGVDTSTAQLERLADAQNDVAVASSNTEKATLSLESRFAAIERRYNTQVRAQQDYEKVQRQVNAAVAQNPALQDRANAILTAASERYKQLTSVANDNTTSTGLARHELLNLSRQVQDVTVSIAGGQSIFTVFLQQGSQIGDIFASSNATLGGFAQQVKSVITPVALLGVGIVALGAATALGLNSWKQYALALDDASRQANVTSQDMAKLQAAASFKGIGQNDFFAGIQQFSANVFQARQGLGDLAAVFRANGTSATSFNDALEKGADIIRNASSDQQRLILLQQMGLPATMQWVRLMSQGAEGIRAAKDAAAEFGGAANDNLVLKARQFDEAWNKAWTNFGLNARSAFQVAISAGSSLFDRMERLAQRAGNSSFWSNFFNADSMKAAGVTPVSPFDGRFSGTEANPAAGNTLLSDGLRNRATQLRGDSSKDKDALQALIGLEQQRIGILSQTAGVGDQVRSVELQIAQARLNGVNITRSEEAALKDLARQNALGTSQMRAQVDALNVQTATIGMSAGAAAAYTAEQNRLNEALRNHQTLSAQDRAEIKAWADLVGKATEANARAAANDNISFGRQTALLSPDDVQIAQQLRQIYPDVATALGSVEAAGLRTNQALSGVGSQISGSLVTGLADITDGTKSAGQGFADLQRVVIRALEEMLIKIAIVTPAMRALQAAAGAFGGFLGFGGGAATMGLDGLAAIHHTGHGPGDAITSTRAVNPAVFATAPRFHTGIGPGERAAVIKNDESVLTAGQMRALGGAVNSAPVTNVYIEGAPSQPTVSKKKNDSGGFDITIGLKNMVRDVMLEDANNSGPITKAMGGRFRNNSFGAA